MYGIGGIEEWERPYSNQQESPQITQGLLGSSSAPNRVLDEVMSSGENKAAQLGEFAQMMNPAAGNDFFAQQQAATQQLNQQAQAQREMQDARNGTLLMRIAKLFFK